jgi:phospholipid N-methyltransferase
VLPDLPYAAHAAATIAAPGGRRRRDALPDRLDYGGTPSWAPDLALHSLITPAALAAAALAARRPGTRRRLLALAAGLAGHALTDLPVHHSDARPHLWPLSPRRWRSPLSAWDPRHHAVPVAAAEHLLAGLALASLAQHVKVPARRPVGGRPGDLAAFLRAFAASPQQVGAIAPTSPRAARVMLGMADWEGARTIAELGPGTGAFTRGILARARPDATVLAIEADPRLASLLRRRHGSDARLQVLAESAAGLAGRLDGRPADIIVSGLPFTSLPRSERDAILTAITGTLAPGGVLLAIQYSTARQGFFEQAFGQVDRRFSVLNLPPAVLYACRGPRPPARG